MPEQRKLAAIMFTDIVGYTALMSKDEKKALRILQKSRDLLKSFIKQFNGEWLQAIGDGTLSNFASVVDAVNCALEVQRSLKSDPELSLRIGIHIGDVVFEEGEIYGDGVNVASRLETLADPGGICISGRVYGEVRNKPGIEAAFLGEKTLKNFDLPMKVYALAVKGLPAALAESKPGERPSITKPRPSIVVMPFEDISPGKDNEYFSDGLTEEIITDLSQVHELRVISRTSAMMLKGIRKSIKTIAQELNVQYVLEGSVRKAGNNLRIAAQLIDALNDEHLWAEKYIGTLDDVFDIQEKVSRSIVDALKLKLSPEEKQKIAERRIENVQAYECYLRARQEIFRHTEDALERALQYLQNAKEIIGENVYLYAGLGYVYFQYINAGIKVDEEYLVKAEECTEKIFELEPESTYGYLLIARVRYKRGKIQEAVNYTKRAIAIDPNNPYHLGFLCYMYCDAGKTSEAVPLLERVLKIDPFDPGSHWGYWLLHLMDGRFSSALESSRKAHQMDLTNPAYQIIYAQCLALNERLNEAYSVFDLILKDAPQSVLAGLGLFLKYAFQEQKAKALGSVTEDLKRKARWDELFSLWVAEGYALINEKEEALNWLEHVVSLGFINFPFLSKINPFLENIRGEKRFKQLMEKVKYEWEHFEV